MATDGILPGLTYVPVRVRATPQNEPSPAAGVQAAQDEGRAPRASRGKPSSGVRGDRAGSEGGGEPVAVNRAVFTAADPQRPHTAWMGEPVTVFQDGDEEASYEMLQQLLSGRRELIGKLRPARPRRSAPADQHARRVPRPGCPAGRAALADRQRRAT